MKTLLAHAYFLAEDPKEQQIMKPYPTLGLLYVSAYLEEHGLQHEVFDTTFSTTQLFKEKLNEMQPQVLALYTNLMTKVKVVEFIDYVRSNPALNDCKIVVGGPDVTYNLDSYLSAGADFLVIGEGEQTLHELLTCLKHNADINSVPGIAYKAADATVKTEARTKMKSLEELPLPNRKVIDLHNYLNTWKTHHGYSALNVSTQRGCPYTCKWCSTAVYGQSYRRRPVSKVIDELAELQSTYNPDVIWFVDDVFTVSHKWLKAFRDEILEREISIHFECITRAERMNDEVIGWLKDAGCIRVWIGAESGSQRVIDAMDRRVDVDNVKEMLIKTKAAGIETGTFIMVGYPGEKLEDIYQTSEYLAAALPDHYTITKSYPIKGTALYQEIEGQITHQPDWKTSTDRDIDFTRPYGPSFYSWAIRYIYNRVELERSTLSGHSRFSPFLKMNIANTMMRLLARS